MCPFAPLHCCERRQRNSRVNTAPVGYCNRLRRFVIALLLSLSLSLSRTVDQTTAMALGQVHLPSNEEARDGHSKPFHCTSNDDLLSYRKATIDVADDAPSIQYAKCGNCHCIPDNPSKTSVVCPAMSNTTRTIVDLTNDPNSSTSKKVISKLKEQTCLNPYKLECNPYDAKGGCQTTPPQNEKMMNLGETAVCGIKYEGTNGVGMDGAAVSSTRRRMSRKKKFDLGEEAPSTERSCPTHYHLVTYGSRKDVESDGAHVTHTGACGVCSTTQDLAAYLSHADMQEAATMCMAEDFLINDKKAIDCFVNLGLTKECAKAWLYDGKHTKDVCLTPCVLAKLEGLDNNGPCPSCKLNACLTCDEEKSGPIFKKFAARTRRRSGLPSMIVRPCRNFVGYISHNPCPGAA